VPGPVAVSCSLDRYAVVTAGQIMTPQSAAGRRRERVDLPSRARVPPGCSASTRPVMRTSTRSCRQCVRCKGATLSPHSARARPFRPVRAPTPDRQGALLPRGWAHGRALSCPNDEALVLFCGRSGAVLKAAAILTAQCSPL